MKYLALLSISTLIVGGFIFAFHEKANAAVRFQNTSGPLNAGPFSTGFIPRDNTNSEYTGEPFDVKSIQISGVTFTSGSATDEIRLQIHSTTACFSDTYTWEELGATEDEVNGTEIVFNFSVPCTWDGEQLTTRYASSGSSAGVLYAHNDGVVNHVIFAIADDLDFEPPTGSNRFENYIPSINLATSSGITTVGARFAITNIENLSYVGYTLFDQNNNIVAEATTTVSDPSFVEASTNYDFEYGAYRAQAYIEYSVNPNGEEIAYREGFAEIQNILIDVPGVEVDPNGEFNFNNATSSTSTVSELTLNCSDGFVGSICNLIEAIVIPSPLSIAQVQNSWNGVLQNLPFSLFTEARNVLLAFQTGSAETGGTFALELYGETVPIVSTSTASAVGLDAGAIDFLKFMMTIGLWILLAWYLYWRVASIFGV